MSDSQFSAIHTVRGLLPSDLLTRLAEGSDLPGLDPSSYHLAAGETLRQAASRKWEYLTGVWSTFTSERERAGADQTRAGLTRERWLLILLRELDFGRLQPTPAGGLVAGDKSFPISHSWQHVPIHLLGWGVDLDKRTPGLTGAAGAAPQSMVQELLNRADEYLWAVLANGQRLRLLRDSTSLIGSAYVEFDLEAMFDGGLFSDFVLLFHLCHQSRFEILEADDGPTACWLERWRTVAAQQGTRALEQLRRGVAEAITTLGTGFLQHPDNTQLRKQLANGDLGIEDYQRTLLRLVYRLLFWFVAEDRDILHPPDSDPTATQRYAGYFSSARLREVSQCRRGNRQSDQWQTVKLVLDALGREHGRPELGLPGLGGIFDHGHLDEPLIDAALSNEALLPAVRALSIVRARGGDQRRPVDFRNLGAEELGAVYESLLELHPRHDPAQSTFTLDAVAGSERKTTGTFYTPAPLVECLLDTALDPLIVEACNTDHPATALLTITVCDPACGSGHVLVAAARRIAKQLAAIRTGEAEPTPDAVRSALREVVNRCIFGVDINPMAAELAKISLWLETLEPGTSLSFLDANIRVGNSLLGATPALLAAGIPDEAFKPIEGDDKKFAAALAKRNRAERKVAADQGELFGETELRAAQLRLTRNAREIYDRSTPVSLADTHVQAQRYREFAGSADLVRVREIADAWCAAFVWPKMPDAPPAITHRTLGDLERDPLDVPGETRGEIGRLATAYRFFHWHLEFPQIFEVPDGAGPDVDPRTGWSRGFSCVLGNVPWEHVELKEQEFFAARAPEIAEAAGAKRKRLITALHQSDPILWDNYQAAKRRLDGVRHFAGASRSFPLTGRGRIKTDPLFAERGRTLIAPSGRLGIILPTGIATDATTQYFFRDLVESSSLASLYGFDHRTSYFGSVQMQFCLLTSTGADVRCGATEFAFGLLVMADLARPGARFPLKPDEITLLNPNTGTCPVFRSRRDAEITLDIYRRVPILIRHGDPDGNPWGVSFMQGLFNMTSDSHLFHTRDELESDGWTLDGNVFVRHAERMLPLYESKMLHYYDHRWAAFESNSSTREITFVEKDQPDLFALPRYWVASGEVEKSLAGRWKGGWFLNLRGIARTTDERTTIATTLPLSGLGNSGRLVLIGNRHAVAALQACLSSFICDYIARLKLGGSNMNFFVIEQLPALAPLPYLEPTRWEPSRNLINWIGDRVMELSFTAWDMAAFAEDLDDRGPPFRWDEERRALLRAELDAAYFHLYGIERDDADYILDTFPIVKRKDEQRFGEYRTKRIILQIYDAMAEAITTGKPYQTVLDPPPGHGPRHPARGKS